MAPESRDEVRQRIASLYDQAEDATGNYNATRAMAAVTRSRGVPLAKRSGRRPDPALDAMARQWFDAARAKLGPTVPAALPADRLPDRPSAPAPSRSRSGSSERDALDTGLSVRQPRALERADDRRPAELTTGGTASDPTSPPGADLNTPGRAALLAPRRPELPGIATNLAGSAAEPGPLDAPRTAQPTTSGTGAFTLPGLGAAQGAAVSTAPATEPTATLMTPGARGAGSLMAPGAQEAGMPMAPGAQEAAVLMAPAGQEAAAVTTSDTQGTATLMAPGTQGDWAVMTPGAGGATAVMTAGVQEDWAATTPDAGGAAAVMTPDTQGDWAVMTPGAGGATAVMTAGVQEDWAATTPDAGGAAAVMTPGTQGTATLMAPGTWEASALTTPGAQGTPLGGGTAETAALPVTEPAAAPGAPVREPGSLPGAAVPGRPSPATSKAYNQRKLAAASDQLTRHTSRLAAATTAVQSTPVQATQPDAGQAGQTTGQWQQSQWAAPDGSATTPQAPAGTIWPDAAASPITTGSFPSPAIPAPTATDTGSVPYPANATGSFPSPAIPAPTTTDTGSVPVAYPGGTALTATGSFQAPGTPASPLDTGSFQTLGPASTAGTGVLPQTSPVTRAAKAIAFARAQIGKPCVWGATGPDSYDCSSLTQAAWRAAGVTVPRAAHEQAFAGAPVTPEGIEPGDLVLFFDDDRHVGLHVGGGMMVHAPGPGSTIREESIYGAGESAIHRIVRPA